MPTVWAEGLAALLLLAPPAAAEGDDVVEHDTAFTIADAEIHESSGLVDAGRVVYTVNDSGSDPLLYALDPVTGETLGTTSYAAEVEDTEALAPGRGRRVWVGDIGDNLGRRQSVAVYDVRPGRAGARRFELVYPDGPRDAEVLLAHPRTGRLFVVSKRVFGGVVYAAPRTLDHQGANEFEPFARVPGLVTGGEFLPDGEHVLLRTYGAASVFTFPAFELVGTVTLPEQEQGEALSVGPDGRVLVSSEGLNTKVLRIELPAGIADGRSESPAETASSSPRASSTDAPEAAHDVAAQARPESSERSDLRGGLLLAAGLTVLTLVGWRLRRLWRRAGRQASR